MKHIMSRLFSRLKNEDGSSTVEFVLIFPILFGIFMSGWETSTYIMRYTLLDRALDITMRDLRLGRMPGADHDGLKDAICDRTILINNCDSNLKLSLQPIDTGTFAMPTTGATCVDRTQNVQPVTTVNPGAGDEIMLVRACVIIEGVFPGSAIGTRMPKEPGGGYIMVAKSIFVNEP